MQFEVKLEVSFLIFDFVLAVHLIIISDKNLQISAQGFNLLMWFKMFSAFMFLLSYIIRISST